MDVGFETIGNATLICHDRRPVLVTDPWLGGDPYFGSWTMSHEIPNEQMNSITSADYVWMSHGHPDHLSLRGLQELKAKVLLPDHVGGRIASFLRNEGYDVIVLKDRVWNPLSDRIKVLTFSDYNQDGVLLIDINGRLIVNLNDASDRGWGPYVRSIVKQYETSFLLRLSGFGDADMINIYDENGNFLLPRAAERRPVGKRIARMSEQFGATYFVPFSSMHKYQRADSAWADKYTTELPDYAVGFESNSSTLLPAFIRYDCVRDTFEEINPPERQRMIRDPKEFGDNWDDELEESDFAKVSNYFKSISHLERHFDFINIRVGGKDNIVSLAKRKLNKGITFDVPRTSLMIAVESEIFDDLLIGNFMKTTLHGERAGLYPHFSPYVAKYSDNGRAKTNEEVRAYFREYMKRAPVEYLRDRFERVSREVARSVFHTDSGLYRITKYAYHKIKGR
jgi:hypothetical protein